MITTVTQQPVTVPMELIRQLDLKPGTQLDWSVRSDGTLVVRPLLSRAEQVRRAVGMGQAWLQPNQSPVTELIAEREAADSEELLNRYSPQYLRLMNALPTKPSAYAQ